jgi:hypothetical protein
MKTLAILALLVILSLLAVPSAFAMDGMAGDCPHHEPTIESLHHCVHHAEEMGHITNAGVAKALHAKLDAAQAALDRGQPDVAVNNLEAFIHLVQAQSGKSIDPEHASHMVMHAEMVIAAIS